MSGTLNIRRVGSAEVVSKNGDDLWVRIRLSNTPTVNWLQFFKNPISCQHDKTHPSNARFGSDNTLDFESTMKGLENDIKLMDRYLEQANIACIDQKTKELADIKRKEDLEAEKKEELRKINESIKDI
ncbi:MAG TPA: hypothetical protein VF350_06330 [Candidatus Bathyarchaeia archaeon]